MKDSGKRRSASTGAHRDIDDNKPRIDLISPFMLERLGKWTGEGARGKGERNWEKGMPLSWFLASLCRHLNSYQQTKDDEDHLAAILWNAMALAHGEEMISRGVWPVELDDLPDYREENDK